MKDILIATDIDIDKIEERLIRYVLLTGRYPRFILLNKDMLETLKESSKEEIKKHFRKLFSSYYFYCMKIIFELPKIKKEYPRFNLYYLYREVCDRDKLIGYKYLYKTTKKKGMIE